MAAKALTERGEFFFGSASLMTAKAVSLGCGIRRGLVLPSEVVLLQATEGSRTSPNLFHKYNLNKTDLSS